MKVLYLASHVGFVIPMMVHKMSYHQNDDAGFVGTLRVDIDRDMIISSGIFSVFLTAKISCITDNPTAETIEEANDFIVRTYDKILSIAKINLESFDVVYATWESANYWPRYLDLKKRKYIMWEIYPNVCHTLSQPFLALPTLMKTPKADTWKAPGEFCEKILYNFYSTLYLKNWDNDIEKYNYSECSRNLSNTDKKKILDVFKISPKDFVGKWNIFLPNSNMIKNIINKNNAPNPDYDFWFHWVNQFFVDFYVGDKEHTLVVKAHPHERASDEEMQKILPCAKVWSKGVLADIFPIIEGLTFENCYSVTSSSGYILGEIAKKTYIISVINNKSWYNIGFYNELISLYFSSIILESNRIIPRDISCFEISAYHVKTFYECAFPTFIETNISDCYLNKPISLPKKCDVVIINLRNEQSDNIKNIITAANPETVILLNLQPDNIPVIIDILSEFNSSAAFKISKTKTRSDYVLYNSFEDEYIMIASNDPQISNNCMISKNKKELNNAGILLTCEKI